MKQFITIILLAGLVLVWMNLQAQHKEKAASSQILPKVMDGLTSKFPKPTINKWTKETEESLVIYDIEFTQAGKKFEADIKEDGSIHNWEQAIAMKDLPPVVRKTIETKYPKFSSREVMKTMTIKDGKDQLESYEITLRTRNKKHVEITVAPDGTVLEDSGAKK